MLTSHDIVYYGILLLCTYFSFQAQRSKIFGLVFLRLLLCIGLLNEVIVEVRQHWEIDENLSHYYYIPFEYALLVGFYIKNTHNLLLVRLMKASVIIYVIISFCIASSYYHFKDYPSLIYNFSCLLNILWIVFLFFEIEVVPNVSLTSLPLFWILTAFLIFYSGIFLFNGVYNYMLEKDTELAADLRKYINISLNYLLYATLTYAFICSSQIKKYS